MWVMFTDYPMGFPIRQHKRTDRTNSGHCPICPTADGRTDTDTNLGGVPSVRSVLCTQSVNKETTSNFSKIMNIQKYDPATIWPEILERIANGESLASALRKPGMPSYALAKIHLRSDPALREAYEQAVQDRGAFLAEELIELADEPIPDDLDPASRSAWVQNKRVRLDTRKWIASRVYRQVYGDRVDVSVSHNQISIADALDAANNRVMTIEQGDV